MAALRFSYIPYPLAARVYRFGRKSLPLGRMGDLFRRVKVCGHPGSLQVILADVTTPLSVQVGKLGEVSIAGISRVIVNFGNVRSY